MFSRTRGAYALAAFFLFALISVVQGPLRLQALQLSFISDLISTSAPGATSSHVIQFTATTAIPASGKIVLIPENEAFGLQNGYNHLRMSFAVSTSGPFSNRTMATTTSTSTDGVAISPENAVTITLNSTTGIPAGALVRITLNKWTSSPLNPSIEGSYRILIRTLGAANVPIDNGSAMIAIVQGVVVKVASPPTPPMLYNGLPTGEVAAPNGEIEVSFQTNEVATCRYALTPGVPYDSMTEEFLSDAGGTIFHKDIYGHAFSTTYTYYIRCKDSTGTENSGDFIITFYLAAAPISNTSIVTEGGNLGRGGVGIYPNGSNVLYLADVTLAGWGPPQSTITTLKDGVTSGTAQSSGNGVFSAKVSGMERGVYTFSTYATDSESRETSLFTATISLQSGTQNKITNIVIPPSIELDPVSVGIGTDVRISGKSVPGSSVETYLVERGKVGPSALQHFSASSSAQTGAWEVTVPGNKLNKGVYSVQARTRMSAQLESPMSRLAILTVGQVATNNFNRSDLNRDGKVNLVDFSILLSFWTTDDEVADINEDGIVNLADFSIMLFNWTG
jgi:hypothetical protein